MPYRLPEPDTFDGSKNLLTTTASDQVGDSRGYTPTRCKVSNSWHPARALKFAILWNVVCLRVLNEDICVTLASGQHSVALALP